MSKCKIIEVSGFSAYKILEKEINYFIKDKTVISVSMSIREYKHEHDKYLACIIYEE